MSSLNSSLSAAKGGATIASTVALTLNALTDDAFAGVAQDITTSAAAIDMGTIMEPVLALIVTNSGPGVVQLAADAAFTISFARIQPGGIAAFQPAGKVYAKTESGTASLLVSAAGIGAPTLVVLSYSSPNNTQTFTHAGQTDASFADDYEIQQRLNAGAWSTVVSGIAAAATSGSWTPTGSEGEILETRMRARKGVNYSGWSVPTATDDKDWHVQIF